MRHQVIRLKTLHVGPDELLVAAQIGVAAAITGEEIAATIDGTERAVREVVRKTTYIYLEPDFNRQATQSAH